LEVVLHLFDACHVLDFGGNVGLLFIRDARAVQRDFAIGSVEGYLLDDGGKRHVPSQGLPNALVERVIGFGGGFVLHGFRYPLRRLLHWCPFRRKGAARARRPGTCALALREGGQRQR
jgi:hypothetical protein